MRALFFPPIPTARALFQPPDPFKPVRRFWDALRDRFYAAVVCSWLMVLDESMVRWEGRGMPGLVIVILKPTPIGLELRTPGLRAVRHPALVRGLRGQGGHGPREIQLGVPQVDRAHAAHVRALLQEISTGRVLVDDLWFGSVACALALFKHALFAVLNVKIAHRDYPKDQLLAEVGEIRGNSAEARAARQ
eukprot:6210505-Pleurochrysis_carterae.AAC.3